MSGQSMAGVAATERDVFVADRDALDTQDIFHCLSAETGEERWSVRDFSKGQLDFGNGPRATPEIAGANVFFYNAFGRLQCVLIVTGEVVWKKDLAKEFKAHELAPWGTTSSPLLVDGKLIVNPGGETASIVALNPNNGEVVWQTKGDKAAFGSLIVGTFGGRRQIVGHDQRALCGWDIESGRQLWRLAPPHPSDFNVPTPIAAGNLLLVSTENNGTRLYEFDNQGIIIPEPTAVQSDLAPDTHTPVVLGGRVFGVWQSLYCLDLAKGLKPIWKAVDPSFNDYVTAIAAGNHVLLVTKHGELLLLNAIADQYQLISRQQIFDDDPGVYSHPALVGQRMYLRGSDEIVCLDLGKPLMP